MTKQPQIVGLGGHGETDEQTAALYGHVLGLTGQARPRVLHVPTAVGDSTEGIERVEGRLGALTELSHLRFFPYPPDDLRELALEQDAILVHGGNTANMLAIWRVHGFDAILREAWENGVLLSAPARG
jgi:peptidase E